MAVRKTIFTSLAPNLEPDDVRLALSIFLKPWTWVKGRAVEELQNTFRDWLGVKYVFPFVSGRGCLYAILSSLGLQKGDEVLLQAYTCVAVPDPILWIGAKPVYVDIEDDTFNMSREDLEKKVSPRCKAIIVQHTFGLPANLEKILTIAKKHHLFVIEDCAHALGSEYKGSKVGTFGGASFFSFGRDKVISSVFGGIVATNNDELGLKIKAFYEKAKLPIYCWTFQQLCHPIITSLVKATYDLFHIGKVLLGVSKILGITSKEVYPIEKKGGKPAFLLKKMPNVLALLALRQFQKIDRFNEHRIKIASIYSRELQRLPIALPAINKNVKHIFLRYTIQIDKAAELIKKAKQERILLGDWYNRAVAPQGVEYQSIGYDPNSCPVAERIAVKSFNLPTDIHIRERDALRIVNFLKTNT